MPFQPVEATALVELLMTLDGQKIENTLHFRRATDFTVSDLEVLAGDMVDWWTNQLAPNLSADVSLVAVKCTALHDQTGPQHITTSGLPQVGGVNSSAGPNNSAFCVSFRTDLIGRAFRGRNYVPAIPENVITISRISSTVAAAIVTAYDVLLGTSSNGNTWVVVSRTVNKVKQSPVALTNPVTAVQAVDLVMDSQRRRLPGRGQ